MKKQLLLPLLFASLCAGGQNLIPNPGFESLTSCPQYSNFSFNWGPDLLRYSPPWRRACWSADFLHDCGYNEYAGPQAPRTGQGKAGFMAWTAGSPDFREFAQVLLIRPLRAGTEYRFRMYISLADDCVYGVSALGVRFFNAYVGDTVACAQLTGSQPDLLLAVAGGGSMTDKTGWTLVEGTYTAAGGEDHLVIGHFPKDAQTTTLHSGTGSLHSSYYYIDDTSLDSVGFSDIPMPNVFTPNGDGINDFFSAPAMDSASGYSIRIFDRWGRQLRKLEQNDLHWDGSDASGQPVADGVYYYQLSLTDTRGKYFRKAGFVHLVR